MSAVSMTVKALLAAAGVTGTTGTRIFPLPLPHGTQLPAIAVALSSEFEERMLAGASRYPFATVQIHCIGATAKAAQELGEAVKTALRDLLYTSGAVKASFLKDTTDFSDFSDDLTTHRRVMAYEVRWR